MLSVFTPLGTLHFPLPNQRFLAYGEKPTHLVTPAAGPGIVFDRNLSKCHQDLIKNEEVCIMLSVFRPLGTLHFLCQTNVFSQMARNLPTWVTPAAGPGIGLDRKSVV